MEHNIFKYMIFQKHQKVLLWSKGLASVLHVTAYTSLHGCSLTVVNMESQPQNPEFRNNSDNFYPCELYTLKVA